MRIWWLLLSNYSELFKYFTSSQCRLFYLIIAFLLFFFNLIKPSIKTQNQTKQQQTSNIFPFSSTTAVTTCRAKMLTGAPISIPCSIQGLNEVWSPFAYAAEVHKGLHISIIAHPIIYTFAPNFFLTMGVVAPNLKMMTVNIHISTQLRWSTDKYLGNKFRNYNVSNSCFNCVASKKKKETQKRQNILIKYTSKHTKHTYITCTYIYFNLSSWKSYPPSSFLSFRGKMRPVGGSVEARLLNYQPWWLYV